jgi:integrase/recombinase XerD
MARPKKKRLPLSEVRDRFLRDIEMRNEPLTLMSYRYRVEVLVQLLADLCKLKYLDEVEVDHLRQCAQHLLTEKIDPTSRRARRLENGSTLSIATVRGFIRVWKAFFNWCLGEELIDRSPADARFKPPKPVKKIKPTFTEDHILKMLSVFDTGTVLGFRNYVILVLLLDTGMRLSELASLRVEDVYETYVKVYGKGRKEREIGIYTETRKLVWKYVSKYRDPVNDQVTALFLTRSGTPLGIDAIKSLMQRVKQESGLEDIQVSAHVFRHTFAKMYLKSGGDLFKLSREMGHSDVQVTKIYLEDFDSADAREDHNSHSPIANLNLKRQYRKRKK